MSDIKELQEEIRAFVQVRDWEQHHTSVELARAIMVEAGELNALFLWGISWQAKRIWTDNPDCESIGDVYTEEIRNELADVLIYALRLADMLGADVSEIIRAKMVKNGEKYPVSRRNIQDRSMTAFQSTDKSNLESA